MRTMLAVSLNAFSSIKLMSFKSSIDTNMIVSILNRTESPKRIISG